MFARTGSGAYVMLASGNALRTRFAISPAETLKPPML